MVYVLGRKAFAFGELIQLLIVVVLFAVLSIVAYKVLGDLNTDVQADADVSVTAKAELNDLHSRFPATFDGAFLTIFGLLFLVGVVASLMIESHPAFIIVVIVLMSLIMVAAGFLSESWDEFMADDELVTFSSSFPMTDWILSNLLLVIGIMTVTFGGIIYFKQRI